MTPWERADLSLRLLAVDPGGLGGLWLRARSGPVRERFVAALAALPLPRRKIHPQIADEQLFGGVDLSATLGAGKVVWQEGVLSRPCAVVLPMAERCPPGLAARLGAVLDAHDGHTLIALDEGAEPEEALPEALTDRLALHVDLDGVALAGTAAIEPGSVRVGNPLRALPAAPDAALADLTAVAVRLGIASLRAPLFALRAARAHAALSGRETVATEDLSAAVELVLAPRATRMPAAEDDEPDAPEPPPPPEQQPDEGERGEESEQELRLPEEILLEAAAAALPRDLLEKLAAGRAPRVAAGASGSGAGRKGNRRGRPLPPRPGRLDGQSRVDLISTLRAAAPWQPVRRKSAATDQRLHVRQGDIRTKRYQEQSDRLLIFVVDASGSAAMTRLAEAKGAVELLLGEAYARRDHVALVAFRGEGAEVLLPPTRSLVQTKRRLAALPGGGGTPLAAGLSAAMDLARAAQGRGMTPTLALITDGRANIALDGTANRGQAGEDATRLARAIRAQAIPGLVIDMSPRPQRPLEALAAEMGAPYLALPRADASRLSKAVSATLDA
ncbi:magnesium chelatase subunit D [Rhodovulum sp. 12E13]|uniref:magnesium chelatase subunit D n=1 Tax=Rhodovulum sp. 12E13 TaxID=2203891 RepID=UPI000E19D48B|nr:magnesium chelatase subunit D [Rhodovulum sp. 12E13]RDC74094.1 magnesium chelatase subunit D [Rhodovulum sp. 12E13]